MNHKWTGIDPDTGTDYDAERLDAALEAAYEDMDACEAVARKLAQNVEAAQMIASLSQPGVTAAYAMATLECLRKIAEPLWLREARGRMADADDANALTAAGI